MTAPVPALAARDITFDYGKRRALSDVSFSVVAGETVILLGPNGAGKSTLFSLIGGLFASPAGKIEICGRSVAEQGAPALAPLGIVFQAQTLDLDLTVRQNLRYFCALHGMDRSVADERIIAELTRMAMAERIDEKVRALNGGHRRRVEIARAALHRPKVLLLDEPTVGLDIPTRRELIADLHGRARNDGTALLWATHLIDEVAENDRVIVLHNGRIVADGSPATLRELTATADLDAAFAALTAEGQGA
jgi:ABC-2 type transport system ATP-binding protein